MDFTFHTISPDDPDASDKFYEMTKDFMAGGSPRKPTDMSSLSSLARAYMEGDAKIVVVHDEESSDCESPKPPKEPELTEEQRENAAKKYQHFLLRFL